MKTGKRVPLFALWLAAGAATPFPQANEAVYFPLEKGNYWIYTADRGRDSVRMEVIQRTENIVELMRGRGTLILRDRGPEIDIQLPEEGFVLYSRFVPGSTWKRGSKSACFQGPVKVELAKEPVVTRAGKFEKCLHFDFARLCMDAGIVEEWWAPNVGLVKWTQDNVAGFYTFELSEYVVKNPNIHPLLGRLKNELD